MYELDRESFRQALEAVPEETAENTLAEIKSYLLENVFRPALCETPLIPNQIDYSQFSLDDMYDMLDAAKPFYHRRCRVWRMNQSLCSHPATDHSHRAFC